MKLVNCNGNANGHQPISYSLISLLVTLIGFQKSRTNCIRIHE